MRVSFLSFSPKNYDLRTRLHGADCVLSGLDVTRCFTFSGDEEGLQDHQAKVN